MYEFTNECVVGTTILYNHQCVSIKILLLMVFSVFFLFCYISFCHQEAPPIRWRGGKGSRSFLTFFRTLCSQFVCALSF